MTTLDDDIRADVLEAVREVKRKRMQASVLDIADWVTLGAARRIWGRLRKLRITTS